MAGTETKGGGDTLLCMADRVTQRTGTLAADEQAPAAPPPPAVSLTASKRTASAQLHAVMVMGRMGTFDGLIAEYVMTLI